MVLFFADKELSVTRNISPHKREAIRMRGTAFLLFDYTANTAIKEALEKFNAEDKFSMEIYLYSAEAGVDVGLNERGFVPLDGDLTISKGNGSASFRGGALLNRDLWMQMLNDISNISKKDFTLNCDYLDGSIKNQDANSVTCKVQISILDYCLDFSKAVK